jgi:hypothetical protein
MTHWSKIRPNVRSESIGNPRRAVRIGLSYAAWSSSGAPTRSPETPLGERGSRPYRSSPVALRSQRDSGFAARAAREKRAGYINHVRRATSFIKKRSTASSAKASCCPCSVILKPSDGRLALDHAKPPTPTANISGIRRAVCTPIRTGMVVPSPSGWKIDLDLHCPTKALAGDRCCGCSLCLPDDRCVVHGTSIIGLPGAVRRAMSRYRYRPTSSARDAVRNFGYAGARSH